MLVCDIAHVERRVSSTDELDTLLGQRRGDGANAFWFVHEGKAYPRLALLVRGELASVHYFPADRDAGYVPVGNLAGLPAGAVSRFSIGAHPADDMFVVNDAVVPVALRVAHEFFRSDAMPAVISWEKL
jgi:hypothetical protein